MDLELIVRIAFIMGIRTFREECFYYLLNHTGQKTSNRLKITGVIL